MPTTITLKGSIGQQVWTILKYKAVQMWIVDYKLDNQTEGRSIEDASNFQWRLSPSKSKSGSTASLLTVSDRDIYLTKEELISSL